ncbi:DUF5953 family protein [Archangium primigenium]|uniref:DUF5953 family protein n=1 Tax=[Archangium] primigenium TaxID=2792470 RepID=UPI0019578362|nr:DUF5953 family protein [Archangium primigenium]MBM7114848.1 hypothetical protein [Archangium primigenium]
MTSHRRFNLIVYAPALVRDDGRPVSVVHGMERAVPGLRLEWTVSDEGVCTPVSQRDAWVSHGRVDGQGFPLLCNGDESRPVTVFGWELPADSAPGGQPQFEVHAHLPLEARWSLAAGDVLAAVAESARAFWGHVTPSSAGLDIARQTKNRPDDLETPPRGLPILRSPGALRLPEIPHRLGWLNYWSASAARAIGFPDATRDAELLSRSRRMERGGWIVRLTDSPLDLNNPAHLDALFRVYERFPEMGGRLSR